MTKEQVQALFYDTIYEHDLTEYSLRFSSAKTRLGSCNYGKKVISISTWHMRYSEDAEVKDTILHEIAHALAVKTHGRKAANHGPLWVEACHIVGAKPNRVSSTAYTKNRPPSKYELICNNCGQTYQRHRLSPSAKYGCGKCHSDLEIVKNW